MGGGRGKRAAARPAPPATHRLPNLITLPHRLARPSTHSFPPLALRNTPARAVASQSPSAARPGPTRSSPPVGKAATRSPGDTTWGNGEAGRVVGAGWAAAFAAAAPRAARRRPLAAQPPPPAVPRLVQGQRAQGGRGHGGGQATAGAAAESAQRCEGLGSAARPRPPGPRPSAKSSGLAQSCPPRPVNEHPVCCVCPLVRRACHPQLGARSSGRACDEFCVRSFKYCIRCVSARVLVRWGV